MQNYHDLMAKVLAEGTLQGNRTGIPAYTLPSAYLTYDLQEGFPAITTKKLAFRVVVAELIGFFRGFTSAADFRSLGCNIWNANANETPSWVSSPFRRGEDDLGASLYGDGWTNWQDTKIIGVDDPRLGAYKSIGYEVKGTLSGPDGRPSGTVIHRSINQLEALVRTLMTDPTSRRMLITSWNPATNDQVSLTACHYSHAITCDTEKRELSLALGLRSSDLCLGLIFNICSDAILLSIIARLTGYTPKTLTVHITNPHIYESHVDGVREQLMRAHYSSPTLMISDRIKPLRSIDEIAGVFNRIEPDDIWLEGYECHPAIKVPMAA